jgi:hypothetical protein
MRGIHAVTSEKEYKMKYLAIVAALFATQSNADPQGRYVAIMVQQFNVIVTDSQTGAVRACKAIDPDPQSNTDGKVECVTLAEAVDPASTAINRFQLTLNSIDDPKTAWIFDSREGQVRFCPQLGVVPWKCTVSD